MASRVTRQFCRTSRSEACTTSYACEIAPLTFRWSFAALVRRVMLQIFVALDAPEFHLLIRMPIGHRRLPVAADVPAGRPWLRVNRGIGHSDFVNDRVRVLRNKLLGDVKRVGLEVA